MAAPDGLMTFPDDLLSMVLDDLKLSDALQLLQVNRRWRRAVLAHPTYWKRLTVSCDSDETPAGVIALFRHRLACADRRPVHISLAVKDALAFLAAFTESLAFVRELSLTTPAMHGPAVMAALRNPAPELVELRLIFTPSRERLPYPVLDFGAFAGRAPLLTAAVLTNVAISPDVPPCLRGLKEINFSGSQWREDRPLRLPYLFDSCPQLTMLIVSDSVYMAAEDYSNATFPRRVNFLIFAHPVPHRDWLEWLATLTTVPKISIKNGGAETVAVLADHVAGVGGNVSLVFYLTPDANSFVAMFQSESMSAWAADVERNVQAPLQDEPLLRSDAFVGIVNLKERITSLVVQAAAWKDLIASLHALLVLKTLSLIQLSFQPAIDVQPALHCPLLEQLIIHSSPHREEPQIVSADVLTDFIQGMLLGAPQPLRLLAIGFRVFGPSFAFYTEGTTSI